VRACRSAKQRLWLGAGQYRDGCRNAATNPNCFTDSCVKRYSVRGNANAYYDSYGYTYSYTYTQRDTDSYSDTNCYSYPKGDTQASAHSSSSADSVAIVGVGGQRSEDRGQLQAGH
jgi:hypothetical protein